MIIEKITSKVQPIQYNFYELIEAVDENNDVIKVKKLSETKH